MFELFLGICFFVAIYWWLRQSDKPQASDQTAPPPAPTVAPSASPPVSDAAPVPSPEPWRPTPPVTPPAPRTRTPRSHSTPQAEIGPNATLAFIDTETTGTSRYDRIVTLGIATMQASDLQAGKFKLRTTHLVFNPMRPCHPMAASIHGWSDQTLARQPRFADHIADITDQLARADVWLMHNVPFDRRLLTQEFDALGRPLPTRPTYCTMRGAKQKWPGQSARLTDCAARIGLGRAGNTHGALEDALLTAALFSFLHTGKRWKRLPVVSGPTNLVR